MRASVVTGSGNLGRVGDTGTTIRDRRGLRAGVTRGCVATIVLECCVHDSSP